MHRNAIERIVSWIERKKRKPLVLMGARQVGKTWLMNEFARLHYPGDNVVKDVPLYAFGTAMPQLLQTIESEDREDDGP